MRRFGNGTLGVAARNSVVPSPPHESCKRSVLMALAYSDLFDYPLTLPEIVCYQIGTSHSRADVEEALDALLSDGSVIAASVHGMYALSGRERLFALRLARARASRSVWRRAAVYGWLFSRLPFVRMVAVTGALAVDNIAERPDIDLLVVTEPGRVWVTRRLMVILVRLARLLRDDVCPNYILSAGALALDQQDLFTAHELAQMVPLSGSPVYRRIIDENRWARDYLPAAFAGTAKVQDVRNTFLRRAVERFFRARLFDGWERWEMERLRGKLRPHIGRDAEVVCSPTQCKGHTGLHRRSVTARFDEQLRALGLE